MKEINIDLRALENADDETLGLMAEKFFAFTLKDKKDLFEKSLSEYRTKTDPQYKAMNCSSRFTEKIERCPEYENDTTFDYTHKKEKVAEKNEPIYLGHEADLFELNEDEKKRLCKVNEPQPLSYDELPEKTDDEQGLIPEIDPKNTAYVRRAAKYFGFNEEDKKKLYCSEDEANKKAVRRKKTSPPNYGSLRDENFLKQFEENDSCEFDDEYLQQAEEADSSQSNYTAAEKDGSVYSSFGSYNNVRRIINKNLENYVAELNSIEIPGSDEMFSDEKEKSNTEKKNIHTAADSFKAEKTTSRLNERINGQEKENLFAQSIQRYIERNISDTESPSETEYNIEVYKKSLWRKYASVAAGIVLLAGIGAGTYLHIKNDDHGGITSSEKRSDTGTELNNFDIHNVEFDKVCFISSVYDPHLIDTIKSEIALVRTALTVSGWTQLDTETIPEYDECYTLYIYNGGNSLKLELFDKDKLLLNGKKLYLINADCYDSIRMMIEDASNEDDRRLIWCEPEKLASGDIWGISGAPKMFEKPTSFEKYRENSNFIEYPILNSYDVNSNIEDIISGTDNYIIGTVRDISYDGNYDSDDSPFARTLITVEVSYDRNDLLTAGDEIQISTAGGFFKGEDHQGVTKYYHLYALNGNVPMVGQKYAFFVDETEEGEYSVPDGEYGMLYIFDRYFYQCVDDVYQCWTEDEIYGMK